MRRCNCCGEVAVVLLKPATKLAGHVAPTIVCHRCDYVGAWPNTRRALRRTR